jgi:SLT domain-containing protein
MKRNKVITLRMSNEERDIINDFCARRNMFVNKYAVRTILEDIAKRIELEAQKDKDNAGA